MIVDQLKKIVGPSGWTSNASDLEPHLTEWRDIWHGKTLLMVSPESTEMVAEVVRACAKSGTAIVPQGGNTGLCGGAIPDESGQQVLLSLSRMNRIRAISAQDYSLSAEAGCTLASIQAAAEDVDRFFPLSLAAEGSCQIGGNLSTNAGGINVLRYGTARAQALGLEVVLADGTVWDGLRSLRKDTAGYDLKQMFIGAEGTLGIITAACLRLYPAIRNPETVLVAVDSPDAAVALLAALRAELSDQLQAFELFPARAVRYVLGHIPSSSFPLDQESPWFVLLETSRESTGEDFAALFMSLYEESLISDAVLAKNRSEANALWRLRHSISEAQKREGASLKHDISAPIGRIDEFLSRSEETVLNLLPDARLMTFGHVGDGNLHYNVTQPIGADAEEFRRQGQVISDAIYDLVSRLGGSFSAEHGVGTLKKDYLQRYRSDTEIGLMRTLKLALDPKNTLNPGKVI